MKTKANQSAAERNITMVALANIQPSGFNPRKRFDETSLYELAESIKRQGVFSPSPCAPLTGQTVTGLFSGNAVTVRPSLRAGTKFPQSFPSCRTRKPRKWRLLRTCSART